MIDPDRPLPPEPEMLTKVLHGGRPIVAWVCPVCAAACKGGKSESCQEPELRAVCPGLKP